MNLLSTILSLLYFSAKLGDARPIDTRNLSPRATDPLVKQFPFPEMLYDFLILPVSAESGMQQSVLAISASGSLFRTHDFGMNWERVDGMKNVVMLGGSHSDIHRVYLLSGDSIFVSFDRGNSFTEMKTPPSEMGSGIYGLEDHPNKDWYIYETYDCSQDSFCFSQPFYTKDRGHSWAPLFKAANCYFVNAREGESSSSGNGNGNDGNDDEMPEMHISPDLIYCEKWEGRNNKVYYSSDFFAEPEPKSLDIKGLRWIGRRGDFVIAVVSEDHHHSGVAISRDGLHFHRAVYPPNVNPEASYDGFTTLQSKGSLVVYVKDDFRHDFGTVLHSGGYGYEFTTVLENVYGMKYWSDEADYTPIYTVEGVILANIVENPEQTKTEKELPIIKTLISHSDGAKWAPLKGPSGEPLHLREFSNNEFFWDELGYYTPSSTTTAAGIYISTGNEGERLSDSSLEYSTYMTRDGGMNWFKISETPMIYAIGDQGAIIIMASAVDPVDHLKYSRDEGATWQTYKWGYEAAVWSLQTVPSSSTCRFIMTLRPSAGMDTQTITLDFCTADLRFCEANDFEPWTPEHPQLGTKCLLGREVEYTRKIRDRECSIGAYVGPGNRPLQRKTVKNCPCTREDYECDYTHRRDPESNECKLIEGQKIPSKEEQCKHNAIYWKKITGYRKLTASSCEGGENIEVDERFACPGKEKEFEEGKWLGDPGLKPLPINIKALVLKILLGVFIAIVIIIVLIVVVRFRHEILYFLGTALSSLPLVAEFFGDLLSKHRVSLPEDGEQSLHPIRTWWSNARSYIPFVGKRASANNIDFYSRVGDDERDHILDEESDYRDDSENDDHGDGLTEEYSDGQEETHDS